MKSKFTRILILMMALSLCLPLTARAEDKSVIISFHQKPGPSEKALIHSANGKIKHTYRFIPAMAVEMSDAEIEKIRKDKKVAYVEEDVIYSAVEPIPGDEYVSSWGVQHIGADIAHASGNKGTGVKVAVIDTGIDYTHEDLEGNYRGGYDFVFDDNDPFDDSTRSHGTHVAGIIAGEENGFGIIGVAPEAELYAVKVLDGGGFGALSWITAGIEWAIENNMDIINMSLEGPHMQSLQDICDIAYNSGVLPVAAAGNQNGGPVRYPGAYDSVIAVTGTDADDERAYFSNIGPEVELAAPGESILSTCSLTVQNCVDSGGYRVLSGTSQAAPHVTGTAALFLTSDLQDMNGDGTINHEDVRQALQATATDLGMPGRDTIFGFGLVDAAEAENEPLSITLIRTSGSPAAQDAETVLLSGGRYEITINNNGLSKVRVDVFEDGVFQKDLSSSFPFNKKSNGVTFSLDATGRNYEVIFTPYGKSGTSADIFITMQ